jgi:hypothetical protein
MLRRPVHLIGSRRQLTAAVLSVAMLLTGCSGGSGEKAPASGSTGGSTSPSPGTGTAGSAGAGTTSGAAPTDSTTAAVDAADSVVGRSGTYSVVPPDGWREATEQAGQIPGVDLVLLSSEKVAGFNSNFVVHLGSGDAATLETELEKGREEMSAEGRVVSDAPAVAVAGVPATGFTTSFTQQGVKVVARSYGLHRKGRIYLLTLSSSQAAAANASSELRAILDSWTWT